MDAEKLRLKEEKLQAQLAKIKKEYAAVRNQRSEEERKERTRQLIELGGLVRMVLGDVVDKGVLAGVLLKNKGYFNGTTDNVEIKYSGDAFISEREAAKKALRKTQEENSNEPAQK